MKKVLSLLLMLAMLVSVVAPTLVFAAEKTVTVTVGDVPVNFDEAKLALLADGNTASDATAFSDAGLVSFENKGFNHTDGVDAAVEATFEIVLDLGEVQTIGSVSLSAYNESVSMIALPTVNYYVSVDGENYYHINAGNAVAPAADAAESAVTTLKADFTTRIAVNAQYVKAVVTFKNGWVFLSELSVGAAAEGIEAENPDKAYAYTEHSVPNPGIGIFDSTDGELDLSLNDGATGKLLSNSQLIKAAYDADTGAYKVIYSKVNAWPNGHTGTETLAEGEILVAISTGGVATSDGFSGAKWIARGLTAGDWLILENGTVQFLTVTPAPSDNPENYKTEIVVGDNACLTDDVTDVAVAWPDSYGKVCNIMNSNCQNVGMDVSIVYDLGETKSVTGATAYFYVDTNSMIGYPEGKATVMVSVDGVNYDTVGEYDLAAVDYSAACTVKNEFTFDAVDAAYVKILVYAGSNAAVLGDSPADGKVNWEFISLAEVDITEAIPNFSATVNVTDNACLTDDVTDVAVAWPDSYGKVCNIMNSNCQNVGMDVSIVYALGETKSVTGATAYFYVDTNSMIGYPEGKATVMVSVDGVNYDTVGEYDLAAVDYSAACTVKNEFTFDAVDAAYVKILVYAGSNAAVLGDSPADGKVNWEFISLAEVDITEAEPEPELPEGALSFQISHVNCYSWGTFFDMVAYGEGRNCHNMKTGDHGCEWWIALKVDNVDGVYTVTEIEGNGETKDMVASADGFIMYLFSDNANYPANFTAAQQVQVGYTVYSNTVNLTTDTASETPIGEIILVPHQHNIVHVEAVEPACHYTGNVEHWYCTICETVWADAELTAITNHMSVILPEVGGEVVQVDAKEPTCQELGNIKYWYCNDCGQVWQDEALMQLTNRMNVILGTVDHAYENGVCGMCGDVLGSCISIGDFNATAGSTVTVDVMLDQNVGMAYLALELVYDTNVLELVSAENGAVFESVTEGKRYIWANAYNKTDTGVLLTLTFKVSEDAEGTYDISMICTEAFDENEQDVSVVLDGGSVTVDSILYGDVNGDGEISGIDVTRLLKYLANFDDETGTSTIEIGAGADTNGDGEISGIDVTRLLKYLANFDDETGTSSVPLGPQ